MKKLAIVLFTCSFAACNQYVEMHEDTSRAETQAGYKEVTIPFEVHCVGGLELLHSYGIVGDIFLESFYKGDAEADGDFEVTATVRNFADYVHIYWMGYFDHPVNTLYYVKGRIMLINNPNPKAVIFFDMLNGLKSDGVMIPSYSGPYQIMFPDPEFNTFWHRASNPR